MGYTYERVEAVWDNFEQKLLYIILYFEVYTQNERILNGRTVARKIFFYTKYECGKK